MQFGRTARGLSEHIFLKLVPCQIVTRKTPADVWSPPQRLEYIRAIKELENIVEKRRDNP